MKINIGDGVTFNAELFRAAGNTFKRLEKEQHGYVISNVNNDLIYVFNGIRVCLVSRKDIIKNHRV